MPRRPPPPLAPEQRALLDRLADAWPADRPRLRARIRGTARRTDKRNRSPDPHPREQRTPDPRALAAIDRDLTASAALWAARRQARLDITYPPELPVSQNRDDIAAALDRHQAIVVCGETGSGKTTQLPKICLELGLGRDRLIGHTQPRRIAARSVAQRIAEELSSPFGDLIGAKMRFSDSTSPRTLVKLMTDGILLAETQTDRFLDLYDAIIIDEAHERSLNIDFLLGYLRNLLPRRPDLKIIVTSATIDPQRFAEHFSSPDGTPAPIIEVSGRTYPVDIVYRPLDARDGSDADDPDEALLRAVAEAMHHDRGDLLVFMPGEREILLAAKLLRDRYQNEREVEILPLYARLSPADQQRIFKPHRGRRIVIATNVAETSITVPGITAVIDPGTARISRYSARSKIQGLPIEPISQASANQRAGRCGRVAPGVCIRLYSEEDYLGREPFTQPEILRTNLASVVLQMTALRLGRPEEFPFVERPDTRLIRDGYETLRELGAIGDDDALTGIGAALARLPVDPRIGRMILAGHDEACLHDVLIIAAGLSSPDPRDRPADKQALADTAHEQFRVPDSDFLALIKIWHFYHELAGRLSRRQLTRACQQNFLSQRRIDEWREIYRQLRAVVAELGMVVEPKHAEADAVHRALLSGLLPNVGRKLDTGEYAGTRGGRFHLFPGSGLFAAKPQWVMAADIVRTTRVYARTAARVRPEWIERVGAHLMQRSYSEPRWDERTARVIADEKVTMLGLEIVPKRTVHYGPIDPAKSRELFIHHALVEGEFDCAAPALAQNRELQERVRTLEAKARRTDLMAEEAARFGFYDARLPAGVFGGQGFERWLRRAERRDPGVLRMREEDLLVGDAGGVTAERFPDRVEVAGATLEVAYAFTPGEEADGVSLAVPIEVLGRLREADAERLVPGLLPEVIAALVRTLPNRLRRLFDAGKIAGELSAELAGSSEPLTVALARRLDARTGVGITADDFRPGDIDSHLRPRFLVVDGARRVVASGRDLSALRAELAPQAKEALRELAGKGFEREGLTDWEFEALPEFVELDRGGMGVRAYPAVVDAGQSVSLRLMDTAEGAEAASRAGIARLLGIRLVKEHKFSARQLPEHARLVMAYAPIGRREELDRDLSLVVASIAFLEGRELPRDVAAFERVLDEGWAGLGAAMMEAGTLAAAVLGEHQRLTLRLGEKLPPAWGAAAADLRAQAARLVQAGFLARTPVRWLRCLPRFLRGGQVRLDRLRTGGVEKDMRALSEVRRWEAMRAERMTAHERAGVKDPWLAEFGWLIEEYRVSVFAQELKTSVPVSPKRLAEAWERVRG